MSPEWKSVLFAIAIALFVAEVIRTHAQNIVAAGLAVFTIPFLADALDAADF